MHKFMVENNEDIAQGLEIGAQLGTHLGSTTGCKSSVGLKRLAWENLPPRLSLARHTLQEQIKYANRNRTLDFPPTSLE